MGVTPSSTEEGLLSRFEENLEEGRIPLSIFNDDSVYRAELEEIFGKSWLFVGHESEIPNPGDYAIRYLADSQFILVRDEDGEIRLLFNSCCHRGAKVCKTEQGNTSHFRCPYHGWTYKNTGELTGVPQKHKAYRELDPEQYRLVEVPRIENYAGFVFATLEEDGPSFEEYLGESAWYLDQHFRITDWEVLGEPQRWEVDLDWKAIAENTAADNYHLPVGHRSATEVGIGSDAANMNIENTLLGIKCGAFVASIYQAHTDEDVFWGHPAEVIEKFDTSALADEQTKLARQSVVSTGTIFPNLSILHTSSSNDPTKPTTGIFVLRQWQPIGPRRTQIWAWVLAASGASEEHKRRVRDAGAGTYGIAGNFLMDDIGILEGIAESAGSLFTRKRDLKTDHTMGMNGTSDAAELLDFPGPGTAFENGTYTDENNRHFYQTWYEAIVGR